MLSQEKLLELDRQRVWHPYAPMPPAHPPLVVAEASGVRLRLAPATGRAGVAGVRVLGAIGVVHDRRGAA